MCLSTAVCCCVAVWLLLQVFTCLMPGGSSISAAPTPVFDLQELLRHAAGLTSISLRQQQQDAHAAKDVAGTVVGGQIVVCGTDSTVTLLNLATDQARGVADKSGSHDEGQQILQEEPGEAGVRRPVVQQSVVLPAEVFSSPVALGPMLLLGCRDDFLYCLRHC